MIEFVDADGQRHLPHRGRQREAERAAGELAAKIADDRHFQVRDLALEFVERAHQHLVHGYLALGDWLEVEGEQAPDVDFRGQAVALLRSHRRPLVPLAQVALGECIESVQGAACAGLQV